MPADESNSNKNDKIVDNVEILANSTKKWKEEYHKLKRELLDKKNNKKVISAAEIENFFSNKNDYDLDDTENYEKEFREIEVLLKVIEGKQLHLRLLNEALVDAVNENVTQIMLSICNDDD